jgi:hypothetical protein
MQGLTETGGTGRRHDTLPAHLSKRFYKRYAQTLLGSCRTGHDGRHGSRLDDV